MPKRSKRYLKIKRICQFCEVNCNGTNGRKYCSNKCKGLAYINRLIEIEVKARIQKIQGDKIAV